MRTSVLALALILLLPSCARSTASDRDLAFVHSGFHVDVPGELRHAADVAHADVRQAVEDALDRIQAKLHTKPTSIKFFAGPQVIPQLGITGFTNPGSGAVTITVDPESAVGIRKILRDNLGPALAHELHHSKRILDGPGYGGLLGQAVVTEGMAVAFERDVYSDDPPFARALSSGEERNEWHELQPHLNDVDDYATHGRWFFGAPGTPRWTGYTIGYHIAKSYLQRHPRDTAAGLALLPTATVVSQSGYRGVAPSS